MSDTQKLAGEVPGIMQEAAQHMRKLSMQNSELVQERDALERENRLMKIARRMEQRGLESSLSFEEKVAKLEEVPAEKLADTEQAIELTAGGFRLGTVDVSPSGAQEKQAGGELYKRSSEGDDLDNFVNTMSAYD